MEPVKRSGVAAMPEYRFYTIRKDGRSAVPSANLDAPDDPGAIKLAKKLINGEDIEIWQGPRLVAYLVSDEK